LLDSLQDLKQGYSTEFLRASSYKGTETSGKVELSGGLKIEDLQGKDVIIVEDIVDTGTTLSHMVPILQEQAQTKSIAVCTLLSKRLEKPALYHPKYIGFSIPNHFIVGYGLDYNELYRDVKDIWVISQKGIEFDANTLFE
jgi:hypoxanthine phosphoribosyltransferase